MYNSYEELKDWLEKRNFAEEINKLNRRFRNKKVLLYGAGLMAKVILDNYDLSKLDVIAVADAKFGKTEEFYNFKTITPSQIRDIKPDIILINTYADLVVREYLNTNYPELKKIPKFPIVRRTIKDKIEVIFEILGLY